MKTPQKLKKILIAIEDSDFSDRALSYGINLAKLLSAKVALVHVNDIPVSSPYISDPLLTESPVIMPELMDIQEDASKKFLERISTKYNDEVNITTFNRIGNAMDEILATADEWKAEMIILGTHGRTGFDHFISGSVAESVVRKAKCPVLVIPNI